ncbi:3'-5' DNA helicase [Microbotryomycetes sp. JL221]|nr:3'-5' DNA helicase [Microbotryomycetes sp. JL221]
MSSDDDDILILDDDAFELIEQIEAQHAKLPPKTAVNVPGLQQRDLFGGVVAAKPPSTARASGSTVAGGSRVVTIQPRGNSAEKLAKTKNVKRWDAAAFAKYGWNIKKAGAQRKKAKGNTGKGKQKADPDEWQDDYDDGYVIESDDEDDDEEPFLVDTSYDPNAKPLPIKWPPDPETSKSWVYPSSPSKPMRTYQYNICHVALFENTLVSLPTGLGKTFIAAVVMLNFYRWFPKGKIIFMAPSRPLVRQQVEACHYIAGIPQSDCVELTGTTSPKLRAVGWATKRLIYATPQTVENDLRKGRVDPRDVVCIVFDEAHKASGDYAYTSIVRYMMSRNRHFRVLALTATPGSKPEVVQSVIDSLHISRVQVRTDQSIDIQQYMKKKSYDLRTLSLGPLQSIRDRWAKLMEPMLKQLVAARLVWGNPSAEMVSAFAVQQAYLAVKKLPGGSKDNNRYFPIIKTVHKMAQAMEYLVVQSLSEFFRTAQELNGGVSKKPEFLQIMREIRDLKSRVGYVGHPKMERLRSICLEHFMSNENEMDPETGQKRETRVMVFCNYRAVVEELVDCLNTQRPLIKATAFVGQSTAKNAGKGMTQKEQIETIRKFKAGKFNVLVASSIGEEGLDIGEIDLIVCYEANKSPIRMLQRVGRTGRARDGHIIVLMSEGREEKNWDKAKDQYHEVQNALVSNKVFELYVDAERMLPSNLKPECTKIEIKARPLDMSTITMNTFSHQDRKYVVKEKKEKKDPDRNVPKDAFAGFRTAGQMAAAERSVREIAPTQILRDRRVIVTLNLDQEAWLRERWQAGLDVNGRAHSFDLSRLPFDRNMSGSALMIPQRSAKHNELFEMLTIMDRLDDSRPDKLDEWHEEMSNAYKAELVSPWSKAERASKPPRHPDLRRQPVEATPLLSSPMLPPTVLTTGVSPTSDLALFKSQSQDQSQPMADQQLEAGNRSTAFASASRVRVARSPHIETVTHSPPRADSLHPNANDVLTSDKDFDLKAAEATVADPQKVVESIEILDSEDDFAMFDALTDSQLMRTIDGEQNPAKVPVSPRRPSKAIPSDFHLTPVYRSPEVVPDSENDESDNLLLGADFIDLTGDEWDFVMHEAEKTVAAKVAPVNNAHPKIGTDSPEQAKTGDEADDSILMPPPPFSTAKRPMRPVKSGPGARRRVIESDSPDIVKQILPPVDLSKIRPARTPSFSGRPLSSPFMPPAKISFQKAAPMRRLVVESSSSSPQIVDAPARPADRSAASSHSRSTASVPATKMLKRLRRGKQAVADSEEDEDDNLDEVPERDEVQIQTKRRVKRKRARVTDKDVARNNLFDFEAVNSSASGTEASSEAYQSEDSDDRAFVASEGEDETLSDGQAQFYRDSLLSQAPGFQTELGRFGGNGANRRRSNVVHRGSPMTPVTPNSQDNWSYDSFCVPDDEEIEVEPSSDRL